MISLIKKKIIKAPSYQQRPRLFEQNICSCCNNKQKPKFDHKSLRGASIFLNISDIFRRFLKNNCNGRKTFLPMRNMITQYNDILTRLLYTEIDKIRIGFRIMNCDLFIIGCIETMNCECDTIRENHRRIQDIVF